MRRPCTALLLLLALWAGCGGTQTQRTREPDEVALSLARERLSRAVAAAQEVGDEQETLTFRARYNPAPACACPDWEIRLRGRWTRVFFETSPENAEEVRMLASEAVEDHAAGGLGLWAVTGTLADDWRPDDASGLTYPVLWVQTAEPHATADSPR